MSFSTWTSPPPNSTTPTARQVEEFCDKHQPLQAEITQHTRFLEVRIRARREYFGKLPAEEAEHGSELHEIVLERAKLEVQQAEVDYKVWIARAYMRLEPIEYVARWLDVSEEGMSEERMWFVEMMRQARAVGVELDRTAQKKALEGWIARGQALDSALKVDRG